jgi:hypothetical protein
MMPRSHCLRDARRLHQHEADDQHRDERHRIGHRHRDRDANREGDHQDGDGDDIDARHLGVGGFRRPAMTETTGDHVRSLSM